MIQNYFFILIIIFFYGCFSEKNSSSIEKNLQKSDKDIIVEDKSINNNEQLVVLETSQGKITIKMFSTIAPLAVENFTTHIKNGYYNHLIFHRIIQNFMIQGGDPTGTGRGGTSIWKKPFNDEFSNDVKFDKPYLLAMANSGPKTNGSQFFITTAKTEWLNGHHTIFGEVVEGKDIIDKLNNVETRAGDVPIIKQEIIKAYLK